MKHIKNSLIYISLSISICTVLSAVLYSLFGRGSFQLITPFGVQSSNPIYNADAALIIYAFVGVIIYSISYLLKHGKFGFNKLTIWNFFVTWIILSFLSLLPYFPFGSSIDDIYSIYFEPFNASVFVGPIVSSLIIYTLIYIAMLIHYKRVTKKLNKKISSNR